MKIIISLFLAAFLLGPFVTAANAQDPGMMQDPENHGMPHHQVGEDNSIWIGTDLITIRASDQTPHLHFWFTGDENGSLAKFSANYVMLAEFEDANGDSAYQSDEVLYHAPLSAYEWSVQSGSIVNESGATTEVWLKYTKGGIRSDGMHGPPMHGMPGTGIGSAERFEDVTIQIWAHIYFEDYYGNVTDDQGVQAEFTVAGGSELKMDIEIGNFPFSSETSSVALQLVLNENEGLQQQHHFRTHEHHRLVNGTSLMNWTGSGGNETMFYRMENTTRQHIDFVDGNTDLAQGFFSWIDKAVITLPGGESEVVNVSASYVPTGHGLALTLSYPNFNGGSILHDPSIGLYEGTSPVTEPLDAFVIAAGIGLVAVFGVIIVLVRRR
ncbi:MAG: hypothetical protein JSW61_10385 [Candidatus Thorarchaeota archaeon]|nr:MAG: hypothetical protein JSW61_10385 [Candidatus Thorarchaeota archaeon]